MIYRSLLQHTKRVIETISKKESLNRVIKLVTNKEIIKTSNPVTERSSNKTIQSNQLTKKSLKQSNQLVHRSSKNGPPAANRSSNKNNYCKYI